MDGFGYQYDGMSLPSMPSARWSAVTLLRWSDFYFHTSFSSLNYRLYVTDDIHVVAPYLHLSIIISFPLSSYRYREGEGRFDTTTHLTPPPSPRLLDVLASAMNPHAPARK